MNAFQRVLTWLIFFIPQVYYSYRYMFKYGNTVTSPTYQDTPFIFQISKYLILTALPVGVLFSCLRKFKLNFPSDEAVKFYIVSAGYFIWLVVISLLSLAGGSYTVGDLFGVEAVFCFPAVLCLPLIYPKIDALSIFRRCIIGWGLVFHTAYSCVQVALYISIRRLPSLAYDGGLVRFGGGWDDPNGFGVYLCIALLLVLATISQRPTVRTIILISVIVGLLFLTVSFSAWICSFVGLIVFVFLKRNLLYGIVLVCLFSATSAAFLTNMPAQTWFSEKMEQKQGSMNARAENTSFEDWQRGAGILEYAIGDIKHPTKSENYYTLSMMSFGVVGTGFFLILQGWTLLKAYNKVKLARKIHNTRAESLFSAGAASIVAVLVASNFIPYPLIFPVNFFLWVICMLIWIVPVNFKDHGFNLFKPRVKQA